MHAKTAAIGRQHDALCSTCSAHVDEDVVGDEVGRAALTEQLAEHIQGQVQLVGLDAHCAHANTVMSADHRYIGGKVSPHSLRALQARRTQT